MAKRIKKYIPKSKNQVLDELRQRDKFNLLAVKPKDKSPTSDQVLISNFEEINCFIDENKRVPDGKSSPIEFKLYTRLLEINLDDNKIAMLREHDRYKLLRPVEDTSQKEEIFIDDEVKPAREVKKSKLGLSDKFGLLATSGDSIFDLKNVKKSSERAVNMPEEYANRRKCKDFEEFRPLFKKCQQQIENGERKIVQFRNEHDVKVGAFFIHKGIKCYVAEIGKADKKNRNNARLRVIFENEQESNILRRSLTAGLYKDGRRILPPRINEGEEEISDDEMTGFIYILRSKSDKEEIKSIPNLHKIGLSTTPVAERIKNAKNEATYLMADVEVVSTFKVAGINPRYFEKLIHKVFGHVQLVANVTDNEGVTKKPKEWFSVPYDVIEDAIALISSGEIVDYIYDSENECLVTK